MDSSGEKEFKQFAASPHPPMKPMAYAGGMAGLMM